MSAFNVEIRRLLSNNARLSDTHASVPRNRMLTTANSAVCILEHMNRDDRLMRPTREMISPLFYDNGVTRWGKADYDCGFRARKSNYDFQVPLSLVTIMITHVYADCTRRKAIVR